MKPYRPCVVAVIIRSDGKILVGERSDSKGAWQLPQGGIEESESPEQALLRELKEEIGTDQLDILSRSPETIRYDFPQMVENKLASKFQGQEQWWFSLRLKDGSQPDLSLSDGEFQNLDWHSPREILREVISWKRTAYERGLLALGVTASHQ